MKLQDAIERVRDEYAQCERVRKDPSKSLSEQARARAKQVGLLRQIRGQS